MESLIKQTRSRFSGPRQDDKDEGSSSRDRKIPPQKTQSFREKKRSQSWLKRQFSRQMSRDNDFSGTDYPAAVAAAALAIQSLEESELSDKKDTTFGPDKSLSKMKSKVDDTGDTEVPPEPRKSALKSSDSFKVPDKKLPTSASTSKKPPEKAPTKKISFAGIDETTRDRPELPPLEKAPPSMRRPATFSDNQQLDKTDSKKPQTTVETSGPSAPKPGPGESRADAWEKEEMASIRERHEKLRVTIDNWETKKKKKAKRKIERIEAELDKRRAKAVQSYHNEMVRIERIAGGARAQAEENCRNEELRAKEKANKIRSTGKLPATCLCF